VAFEPGPFDFGPLEHHYLIDGQRFGYIEKRARDGTMVLRRFVTKKSLRLDCELSPEILAGHTFKIRQVIAEEHRHLQAAWEDGRTVLDHWDALDWQNSVIEVKKTLLCPIAKDD
jgi:xylose isomerase